MRECTTGHPDRDDKLSKLFTRAQGLRGTLDKSGLQQKRILPVLVTALARSEIPQTEIDKAAQMKIALVSREDLESLLLRVDFVVAAWQCRTFSQIGRASWWERVYI